MPRASRAGCHVGAIRKLSAVKVSVWEVADGRVHPVLDAEELDSVWTGLLDSLEETLLISKHRGGL